MLLDFSDDDRALLRVAQHTRLREYFVELQRCILETTSDDRLVVHCSDPVEIAPVTADLDSFRHFAYLATGATLISFYHEGTELFTTGELQANPDSALPGVECSLSFNGEGFMATATLDRPSATPAKPTERRAQRAQSGAMKTTPAISLSEIASDVEQPIEEVRAWFDREGISVLGYLDYELVPATAAAAAYDHFEPLLMQQRRAKRGLLIDMPSTAAQNGRAKKAAKETSPEMTATEQKRKPGRRTGTRAAKPAVARKSRAAGANPKA